MNLQQKLTLDLLNEIERVNHLITVSKNTPQNDPMLFLMIMNVDLAKAAIKNDNAFEIIKSIQQLKTYEL